MTKDEMKNRISIALKDHILQQGFEIICKENAELARKLEQTEKDLADYQFNYPTIKELQEEIAELKEHHKSVCDTLTNTHRNLREKLAEAKEILKSLVDDLEIIDGEQTRELKAVKEAEQFLKEE